MGRDFSRFDITSKERTCTFDSVGKTILVSTFFGLTALISFIIIVISFTQIHASGEFSWAKGVDICALNETKAPVRFYVPKVNPNEIPTPPTTPGPTTNPDDTPTEAPTEAPPAGEKRGEIKEREDLMYEREWIPDPTNNTYYNKYFSKKQTVECPWSKASSTSRILAHAISLVTCILIFTLVMKQESWQAFWFCLLASLFNVVFIFIVFIRDADVLGTAKSYCEDKAKEMTMDDVINPDHIEITCNLTTHVAIAVLNVLWLLWVPNAGLLYVYCKKWKIVIYG